MKTFEINKQSLHYKIAKIGGLDTYDHRDICSYTRRFIFGLMVSILLFVVFVGLSNLLVEAVLSIAFSLIYWQNMFTPNGVIGSIIYSVCGVLLCVYLVIEKISKNLYSKTKKPDGFLKQAYNSHKEKYCVRVDFK